MDNQIVLQLITALANDKMQTVFEISEILAKKGDPNGQFALSYCYQIGKGTSKNIEKAVHFSELAAKQGHSYAQTFLGSFYETGNGVKFDMKKAIELYQSASKQSSYAYNNLASCYEHGKGVEVDKKKAKQYYKLAAEAGNLYAQYNLATCYENGKNLIEAIKMYEYTLKQDPKKELDKLIKTFQDGKTDKDIISKAIGLYGLIQEKELYKTVRKHLTYLNKKNASDVMKLMYE